MHEESRASGGACLALGKPFEVQSSKSEPESKTVFEFLLIGLLVDAALENARICLTVSDVELLNLER
jgi:hypothetical protein